MENKGQITASNFSKIKAEIIRKISFEIDTAYENDNLKEIIEKYGVEFNIDYVPVDTKKMQIIVIGTLNGKVSDYQLAAKKLGIKTDNISFESDYDKLTNFDSTKLKDSYKYSDIIVGAMPHSIKGKSEYSSLIAAIKAEPARYPRLQEAIANNELKLSINSFKECILKTRYYKELIE